MPWTLLVIELGVVVARFGAHQAGPSFSDRVSRWPNPARGKPFNGQTSRGLDERHLGRPRAIVGALPRQENAWPITVHPDMRTPLLLGGLRSTDALTQRPEAGHARTHAWILTAASDNDDHRGVLTPPKSEPRVRAQALAARSWASAR